MVITTTLGGLGNDNKIIGCVLQAKQVIWSLGYNRFNHITIKEEECRIEVFKLFKLQ